jgi:hypothetical protein
MKRTVSSLRARIALFVALLAVLTISCIPYMKMNPPPDSDKPLPVPLGDNSCWMHTASNMLAGAGYGTGTTVQARADAIFAQMSAHYGTANRGWPDAALQWWLVSTNNTWTTNLYSMVTVLGNKSRAPWANPDAPQDMGDSLRNCNMVGMCIYSTSLHHAITPWGDNITSSAALTFNPGQIRVTDSDTDNGGDVQAYSYDAYDDPNRGNGWYFNYATPHPFIENIVTLARTSTGSTTNGVMVTGSYQIHQTSEESATDLHYRVGTDVDILTYRTWLNWDGTPTITEAQPRRELTVDWNLSQKTVPHCTWITINTEFVEPSRNYITYHDVHFTYPSGKSFKLPDLNWKIETPVIPKADSIPNVTGGYVIGSFDVYDPKVPGEPAVRYRFVHQYLYNQSPEIHTFLLGGTPGYQVRNLNFTHSYGYPTKEELWRFEKWMTQDKDSVRTLSDKPLKIDIDWKGRLPYPEGVGGNPIKK